MIPMAIKKNKLVYTANNNAIVFFPVRYDGE